MALRVKECVRNVLGSSSAVIGIYFLSKSSFFELQLPDDGSAKATTSSFLTTLLIVFLFLGADFKKCVMSRSKKYLVMRSIVTSFSFVVVFLLVFLIKHPRFNSHSEYTRPCIAERRNVILRGVEYNLFSLIAFAFLASVTSFKRKEPSQLGFFGNLLGLIIDNCMEINGSVGKILSYILFAAFCCILLIFLRCYAETSNCVLESREDRVGRTKFNILTFLQLVSASFGIILFSLGSFSKMQFEGSGDLKVACFSIFALLIGSCLWKLPNWIDILVSVRRNSLIATAAVNSLLLMVVSLMIFLNKFPRFKVHSEYTTSCSPKETYIVIHGRLFDLCSAGTFAFFALVVSTPVDASHELDLGMFSFLLQLTMDVAIETLENQVPNVFYMLGAFVYCVALIFLETWLNTWGSGNCAADAAAGEGGPGPSGNRGGVGDDRERGVSDENRDSVRSELGGDSASGWEMVVYVGAGNSDNEERRNCDAAAGESGPGASEIRGGVGGDREHGVNDENWDSVRSELGGDSSTGWEMVAVYDATFGVGVRAEQRRNYDADMMDYSGMMHKSAPVSGNGAAIESGPGIRSGVSDEIRDGMCYNRFKDMVKTRVNQFPYFVRAWYLASKNEQPPAAMTRGRADAASENERNKYPASMGELRHRIASSNEKKEL